MDNESPRKVLARRWNAFLVFLIDFGFDVLMGLTIFTGFVLLAWVISIPRAFGWLNDEHLKAYELAHFWMNYGLFAGAVGFAGVARVVKMLFS